MAAVIGLGAGGHAKVVIEILRAAGVHDVVGLLDPRRDLWGSDVLGVPVLGGDELIPSHYDAGVRLMFVGLGSDADMRPRSRLYRHGREAGLDPVSAVHPAANVSPSAFAGAGVTIMAGAIVNAAARLGEDVIVNTAAVVEHDCVLGDHVHVATGARLAGGVQVGNGTHIGLGACVREGVRIGSDVVVAAGAVVIADVESGLVVAGVPARPLRRSEP